MVASRRANELDALVAEIERQGGTALAVPTDVTDQQAMLDLANRAVLQNTPVLTRQMALDDAMKSGARDLFGEKYGEEVRVVSMGRAGDDGGESDPHGPAFSVELCGGTHVARTGDIGLISVVAETAVAAGVRRIEAKTGAAARHHLNAKAAGLGEAAALLKAPEDELGRRLAVLLDERRKLERDLSDARRKLAMSNGPDGVAQPVTEIGGVKFLGRAVSGVEMRDLKALADEAKQTIGSGIVTIVGIGGDGKAGVVVGVTADLAGRFDAVALVRAAAAALGGTGGGGRRDMAQAGGPNGDASQQAIDAVGAMLLREAA